MPPAFDGNKNLGSRDTYLPSLVHCLDWNPALRVDAVPGPLVILQDLYRVIASKWIAVNAYVERDLNTIEYRIQSLGAHSHLTHDYPAHTKILIICPALAIIK
jgi:hypothetical protein